MPDDFFPRDYYRCTKPTNHSLFLNKKGKKKKHIPGCKKANKSRREEAGQPAHEADTRKHSRLAPDSSGMKLVRFPEKANWPENGQGRTSDHMGIPGNLATFIPALLARQERTEGAG